MQPRGPRQGQSTRPVSVCDLLRAAVSISATGSSADTAASVAYLAATSRVCTLCLAGVLTDAAACVALLGCRNTSSYNGGGCPVDECCCILSPNLATQPRTAAPGVSLPYMAAAARARTAAAAGLSTTARTASKVTPQSLPLRAILT